MSRPLIAGLTHRPLRITPAAATHGGGAARFACSLDSGVVEFGFGGSDRPLTLSVATGLWFRGRGRSRIGSKMFRIRLCHGVEETLKPLTRGKNAPPDANVAQAHPIARSTLHAPTTPSPDRRGVRVTGTPGSGPGQIEKLLLYGESLRMPY